MRHTVFLTISGVCLCLGLVVSGWIFMGKLLADKEETLLSGASYRLAASGTAGDEIQVKEETGGRRVPAFRDLSGEEKLLVIVNWEAAISETPVLPLPGQLTMEEAIKLGEDWLRIVAEEMKLPDVPYPYEQAHAYLAEKMYISRVVDEEMRPYYRYWNVLYEGGTGKVVLTMNAATGEVWKIDVRSGSVDDYQPWCTMENLNVYMVASSLEVGQVISEQNLPAWGADRESGWVRDRYRYQVANSKLFAEIRRDDYWFDSNLESYDDQIENDEEYDAREDGRNMDGEDSLLWDIPAEDVVLEGGILKEHVAQLVIRLTTDI